MRREDLVVYVRREYVFEDFFREFFRRIVDEWKYRFYIVFEGIFIDNIYRFFKYFCGFFICVVFLI